jgi:SpoVK/Ycf46/Vps4 family AAA+-type ATPase
VPPRAVFFLSELRTLIDQKSIYKGKVISITENRHEPPQITFHDVPKIDKAHLILPQQIIEQIEKHTSYFSEHRDLLRSRGLHLKRGLLLYGPPGTGKTLTLMPVISTMPERTTILLKAASTSQLDNACALAKSLQPSTVVIDDVDLIAEEEINESEHRLKTIAADVLL